MTRVLVALALAGCWSSSAPPPAPPASPAPPVAQRPAADPEMFEVARLQVRRFATDAYTMWMARNPLSPCPTSLAELERFANSTAIDPWEQPLQFTCDPATASIVVWSVGPDGKSGTADDLRSDAAKRD